MFLTLSACSFAGGGNAYVAQTNSNSDALTQNIRNDQSEQLQLLSTATHAAVASVAKNWDADAEDDGLMVYPELKNSNDETIMFESIELDIDIEVWSTKFDDSFRMVKDRKVYNGRGKIDSWRDGNFFTDEGIRVNFDDFQIRSSDTYGILFVKIHTPDGRSFEAKQDYVSLRAP